MNSLKMIKKFSIAFLFLSALSFQLLTFSLVFAQGPPRITLEAAPQKLGLMVGESKIIKINEKQGPVAKVELVEPKIADAIVLTPWQIYISGKTPGITTLLLRSKDNVAFYTVDLEVSPDISRLKETLHKILPEEKDVKVTWAHDHITLAGTVSSISNLSQVLALTQSYLPKEGKIINLLEVGGVHQVMLEVRVAEMSRSLVKRLGFNFAYLTPDGNFGVSMIGRLATANPGTGLSGGIADSVNAILRFTSRGTTWTVLIDALKEEGLLKVLAEPTLITLSGKTANFLAGGEFPIPVPQSGGAGVGGTTITIEYKSFGVGLNFSPTVLSNKKINIQVAPEVSELDFSRAVTISGFVVPALTTRRVSTVVELADGQSFAIAGLLNEQVRENINKFPVLGEIPILGALFRSSNFQKNETELIVIVTAHLVKPLDMAKQTLPTDQFIEPDDFEFYLLGKLEGKEKMKSSSPATRSSSKSHGLEGNFGHIVPK